MILEPKKNNYIKRLPFSASFDKEKMEVTFSEGNVFDCYKHVSNEGSLTYKNGSSLTKTTNHSDKFKVVDGDHFFVGTGGSIYKVSKEQRESEEGYFHSGILIWKAPSEQEGEEQGLSENLFIQNYEANRQKGFGVTFLKEEDEKVYYKINSGFVFAPQLGYSKFIKGKEFTKSKGDDFPSFRLKINVRATLSAMDPIGDSNINFINDYQITSCILEESLGNPEEERVKLLGESYFLNGTYYAKVSGSGNIHLFFQVSEDLDSGQITAASRAQVRGVSYYKNGVLFNPSEDNYSKRGFYKEILKTTTSKKYTNPGLVPSGDHELVERFYVEGDDLLPRSSGGPEELYELVADPPLASNEVLGEQTIAYEFTGINNKKEISPDLYKKARIEVQESPWIDEDKWTGDGVPVVQGAGNEGGGETTYLFVTHAERRFQKAGIPNVVFADMPNNYIWYGGILYLGESNTTLQQSLPFNWSEGLYESNGYFEINHGPEGIYGKEYISSECEAQAMGGYSTIYIYRFSSEPYQELIMASSADTIV